MHEMDGYMDHSDTDIIYCGWSENNYINTQSRNEYWGYYCIINM